MKSILVVDDDDGIRKMIVMALEKEEFQVIEASNGDAALELANEQQPDLIISDVMMDNVNGFMLAEMLHENAKTASIPLVLMTGAVVSKGAWESDPDITYLVKPFSIPELLRAVQKKLSL